MATRWKDNWLTCTMPRKKEKRGLKRERKEVEKGKKSGRKEVEKRQKRTFTRGNDTKRNEMIQKNCKHNSK